jgi:hypothetical protein
MSDGHAAAFGEACAAIARAAAESRGLDEVVARIAGAVRLVVPFDAMGLRHAENPTIRSRSRSAPATCAPARPPIGRSGVSITHRALAGADGFPVCTTDAPQELGRLSFTPGNITLIHESTPLTWSDARHSPLDVPTFGSRPNANVIAHLAAVRRGDATPLTWLGPCAGHPMGLMSESPVLHPQRPFLESHNM